MSDAIGIEVGRHAIRAVRVDPRSSSEIVGSEFTMDPTDDDSIRDAFVRTYGVVSKRGVAPPVRLAITPDRALLQAIDVTAMGRDDVVALAATAAERLVADASLQIDDGVRRRLLLVRWNPPEVSRLRRIARRSGFADATAEPAMIALGRVLPPGRLLVWREVEDAVGWSALYDDGVPLLGAALGPSGVEAPAVIGHGAPDHGPDPVDAPLDRDQIVDHLLTEAERPLPGHTERPSRTTMIDQLVSETGPLPAFPTHDLRAPGRVAVALGAALGAAGATGRRRTVEAISAINVPTPGSRLPWAVQAFDPEAEAELVEPADLIGASVGPSSPVVRRPPDADDRRRGRRRGSRRRYRRRR